MYIVQHLFNLDFTFDDKRKRNTWELLFPILGCLIILFLRFFLKKFVFTRFGLWFAAKEISNASKESDMEELKTALRNPTILKKFTENCYRLFAFIAVSLLGIFVLWDKPWLWNVNGCWTDFYNQTLTDDVWWYFMICWSFAWSLLISLVLGEKGKDFHSMLIHHVILTMVLAVCWKANLFRIATFVLLANDVCDVFFEAAQVAKCLGSKKLGTYLLYSFALLWICLRLGVIPFRLFKSFFLEVPKFLPTCYTNLAFYITLVIMSTLFILNCVWAYFILKVAINVYRHGIVYRKERSMPD